MTSSTHQSPSDLRPAFGSPVLLDAPDGLGAHLRMVRKDQGLRIDTAASLFGVSVDLMSRLENGNGTIRLDKLQAVLEGLGLALVVGPKADMRRIVATHGDVRNERT